MRPQHTGTSANAPRPGKLALPGCPSIFSLKNPTDTGASPLLCPGPQSEGPGEMRQTLHVLNISLICCELFFLAVACPFLYKVL